MFERLAKRISAICSHPRSRIFQGLALTGGACMFLVVIPALLAWFGSWVAQWIPLHTPRIVDVVCAAIFIPLGLLIVLWAVVTFWGKGYGTPAPIAAPQKLVTTGPFRYCRNPIKLGAILYFLGVGSATVSLVAGIVMFAVVLAVGTFYHRLIEEEELRLRFGEDYEAYRRSTPFIIPRLRR